MIRLAITGTDTGVGKTVVAAALLARFRERGLRVAGMKPVETGVAAGDPESDAARLRAAAGGTDRFTDVCPLVLPEPLAPWVTARRAGVDVDLDRLDAAFQRLSERRDVVVVEGAGGLLVPLSRDVTFADLFHRWNLDVVVVAANRLGAINHTLLTVRAALGANLRVRGVVLNDVAPQTSGTAEASNRGVLAELLPGIPVLPFPWLTPHADPAATAEQNGLDYLCPELPKTQENR